jgi:hypothetical protein
MKPTKLIRDGKIAVLYSPGYGAGWSSWADTKIRDFLIFDEGLVKLAEAKAPAKDVEAYLKSKLGKDGDIYTGGWEKIRVEWLSEGEAFVISEYDGNESLDTKDSTDWHTA